jgi:hypothetical protein
MEKPAVPRVQGGNPYVTPGAPSHAMTWGLFQQPDSAAAGLQAAVRA